MTADQIVTVLEEDLPPEEVERILRDRAQELSRTLVEESPGATAEVVTFALGTEVYAIEARYVENIYPLEDLTAVPCTPDFVVGVVNLRGRIFSVVDLRRFLGLEPTPSGEQSQVIAVNAAGLEVGLLASDVRSVELLALDKLEAALPTMTYAAEYTRGITADLVVFLDIEALLRDQRMVVHEEA